MTYNHQEMINKLGLKNQKKDQSTEVYVNKNYLR